MSIVASVGMALLGIGLAALGAILLGMGLRLMLVDREEVRKNTSRARNIWAFFKGDLSSRADPIPDMRIKEGLKFSRKHKKFIVQAGLSDEAVRRGFDSRWM